MQLNRPDFLISSGLTALALVLGAATVPALAAPDPNSPDAVYKSERADCLAGRTQQDLKTCLTEAGAAREAARKGQLSTAAPQVLRNNAVLRCQVQPAGPARSDCERMAQGEGKVSGSVEGGGDLRELTTTVPAKPRTQRAPAAPLPVPMKAASAP